MRAELADDLAQLGRPIAANERASCCPARPMVTVMMPPTASRPYPIDLLLCGHHYRVSQDTVPSSGPEGCRRYLTGSLRAYIGRRTGGFGVCGS